MKISDFDNSTFQRGAPRWKELLWWIVRSAFFSGWFPLPSALRVLWLRFFGAKIGSGVVIRSRVNITFPWRFECGNDVWIGEEVYILSLANVKISNNVCISQQSFLCTGSHDFSRQSFDLVTGPINIGSGVWVGARTFVGPNVNMGEGSRSLAGAVVVRSTAPETTVGGVPALPLGSVDKLDPQIS